MQEAGFQIPTQFQTPILSTATPKALDLIGITQGKIVGVDLSCFSTHQSNPAFFRSN